MKQQTLKAKINSIKRKWIYSEIARPLSLILPLLILCVIKKDEYFVTKDAAQSCTVGFVIAAVVCVMCTMPKFPKINKLLLGLIAVVCIWFMRSIVHDLALISLIQYAGCLVYTMFTSFANKYKTLYKNYEKALVNKETMDNTENLTLDSRGRIR